MKTKSRALKITMGRLLVIGDKGLALRKTIVPQKASHEVTKKHGAQIEAKLEKNSFRNPEARHQLALGKLGDMNYLHSHGPASRKRNSGKYAHLNPIARKYDPRNRK